MELLVEVFSWVLLMSGSAFVLIGGIGALRLPNFYTRMHAASLTDTMGTILILGGTMLQAGLSLATIKLFAILMFLLLTGPTASYALANAAIMSGLRPESEDDSSTNSERLMIIIFAVFLLTLLVITAIAIVRSENLFVAVMLMAIFSLGNGRQLFHT